MLKYSVTDDSTQEELVSKVCEALQAISRGNNQVIKVFPKIKAGFKYMYKPGKLW